MDNQDNIKERKTIFTKIIASEIPVDKIYEDKKVLAFLDINPFEKGHTLLIPKIPYKNISEIPEKEFLYLMKVLRKISTKYREILNCDINIWENDGPMAGQEVEHLHFHIIPRKEKKKIYNSSNMQNYMDINEKNNYLNLLKIK